MPKANKPAQGGVNPRGKPTRPAAKRGQQARKRDKHKKPEQESSQLTIAEEPVLEAVDEETLRREREEARRRWLEEQRKKYPVAPDGYIPNSVVRKTLHPHRPNNAQANEKLAENIEQTTTTNAVNDKNNDLLWALKLSMQPDVETRSTKSASLSSLQSQSRQRSAASHTSKKQQQRQVDEFNDIVTQIRQESDDEEQVNELSSTPGIRNASGLGSNSDLDALISEQKVIDDAGEQTNENVEQQPTTVEAERSTPNNLNSAQSELDMMAYEAALACMLAENVPRQGVDFGEFDDSENNQQRDKINSLHAQESGVTEAVAEVSGDVAPAGTELPEEANVGSDDVITDAVEQTDAEPAPEDDVQNELTALNQTSEQLPQEDQVLQDLQDEALPDSSANGMQTPTTSPGHVTPAAVENDVNEDVAVITHSEREDNSDQIRDDVVTEVIEKSEVNDVTLATETQTTSENGNVDHVEVINLSDDTIPPAVAADRNEDVYDTSELPIVGADATLNDDDVNCVDSVSVVNEEDAIDDVANDVYGGGGDDDDEVDDVVDRRPTESQTEYLYSTVMPTRTDDVELSTNRDISVDNDSVRSRHSWVAFAGRRVQPNADVKNGELFSHQDRPVSVRFVESPLLPATATALGPLSPKLPRVGSGHSASSRTDFATQRYQQHQVLTTVDVFRSNAIPSLSKSDSHVAAVGLDSKELQRQATKSTANFLPSIHHVHTAHAANHSCQYSELISKRMHDHISVARHLRSVRNANLLCDLTRPLNYATVKDMATSHFT